jgi:hypothetical protein
MPIHLKSPNGKMLFKVLVINLYDVQLAISPPNPISCQLENRNMGKYNGIRVKEDATKFLANLEGTQPESKGKESFKVISAALFHDHHPLHVCTNTIHYW